jgi:transcriptional regulator with XRE-family HTH domain
MDMQKIGSFLSQLRKEQSMTQEQLGEKLGVTNKTVSRWETGTYLPPVEMLQLLSELYGITINEILSGERLGEKEYREKADAMNEETL